MLNASEIQALKQSVKPESANAKAVSGLAEALHNLLHKTSDPYVQNVLKSNKNLKDILPKEKPVGFWAELNFIAQSAMVCRQATAFRAAEIAPYTYKHVDEYYEWGDSYDSVYILSSKGYKRGTLSGELSADHRQAFAQDLGKRVLKRKQMPSNRADLNYLFKSLMPQGGGSHKLDERPKKYIRLVLGQFNISDQEMTIALPQFIGATNILVDAMGGVNQDKVSSDILTSLNTIMTIMSNDMARLEDYFTQRYISDPKAQAELDKVCSSLKTYERNCIQHEAGLVVQLTAIAEELEYKNKQKSELSALQKKIDEGLVCHPQTGAVYESIAFEDDVSIALQEYVVAKSQAIECTDAQDDELERYERDADKRLSILTPIFESAAKADGLIKSLYQQNVEIGANTGQKVLAAQMVQDAYQLAERCALEIEHGALCALKATGNYGAANLAAAYMAASVPIDTAQSGASSDDVEVGPVQPRPQLGQGESTLQQLITLMYNDLRCNGWDGQWPDNQKFPDEQPLIMQQKYPYEWLESRYENPVLLNDAEAIIQKDLSHRIKCITGLTGYLQKAQALVPRRLATEINMNVALLTKVVKPALSDIEQTINAPVKSETCSL
jgi:hypothetical protein